MQFVQGYFSSEGAVKVVPFFDDLLGDDDGVAPKRKS